MLFRSHATPIRNVGQSTSGTYFDTVTNQQLTTEQILEYANTDGWQPEHSALTWSQRICLMLVAIIVGTILFPYSVVIPVVPIYIIYLGIRHLNKKQTTYTKLVEVPTYKSDRRCKGGVKFDGMTNEKVSIALNSTDEDKRTHNYLGVSYILCAIALWVAVPFCWTYIMTSPGDDITTEQTKNITDNTDTTHIQE